MTLREFAKHCEIKTNRLSVEISRDKVVCEPDGTIDPENEKNVAFRVRVQAKQLNKQVKQIPREETFIEPNEEFENEDVGEDGILPLRVSEKKKKHFDAINSERNSDLLLLKTEKLKGEVIPTAPIETLIFQFKQHIITQNKTTLQSFLIEIGHKYDISPEDLAYYKGYYVGLLNKSAIEANNSFVDNLGTVLAEFSVKQTSRKTA